MHDRRPIQSAQPGTPPTPSPRSTVCPFCGSASRDLTRCDHCRGPFDPLSRQATQNAMGPWFIRDEAHPFRPGCSLETMVQLVQRGRIGPSTVVRGPASLQFWTVARRCPGIARHLGVCHSCQQPVQPTDPDCPHCGASFHVEDDRQFLGLGEARSIPGREVSIGRSGGPDRRNAAEPAVSSTDPAPIDRPGHTERMLRRSRRWQLLWFLLALASMSVLAALLILPRLSLEEGPIGRWLQPGGGAREPGEVLPPDLPATGETPIRLEAAPGPRSDADGPGPSDSPSGGEIPDPEAPGEAEGPGDADPLGGGEPEARRDDLIDRLRRLR